MRYERSARFEELCAAHLEHVTGYVRQPMGDVDDAADVIAETFLAAWRRLDDVPPGDEARFYLYGVARRTLANLHRGQRRQQDLIAKIGRNLAADLAGDSEIGVHRTTHASTPKALPQIRPHSPLRPPRPHRHASASLPGRASHTQRDGVRVAGCRVPSRHVMQLMRSLHGELAL